MRAPRIPGGPRPQKHNQQNRHTRASKQRARFLDKAKRNYFRYDIEDVLRTSTTPEEYHGSLIQTLWAKGSRDGIDEAKAFLREKQDEGLMDEDTARHVMRVLNECSTVR